MSWTEAGIVLLTAASLLLYIAVVLRLIALEIAWEEGMPDLDGIGLYLVMLFCLVRGRRTHPRWRTR